MIPVSHDPVSRKRYANKNVIKKRIKKSESIYPIRIRNQNANIFSKKVTEKISGKSFRIIIVYINYENCMEKFKKARIAINRNQLVFI